MRPETRKAMEMLFTAKWNVPTAALHCGLSWKEMKITFNEYCHFHPPSYKLESEDQIEYAHLAVYEEN
jgi:hypothetical protein